MKLLVCDDIKISTYNLPEKIENFFLLNLNILVDDLNLNEVLTLKSYNGLWNIVADEKLVIKSNEVEFKSIVLKEYITFSLKFADISKFINFYVIPDFSNYISYSLLNVEKVDIGSSVNCQIKLANLINIATTIYKNGYDYYIQRTDANLNSSYLNSKIYTNMKLSAGDILFIKGLRIIYMKNFLLIDSFSLPLEIKLVKLEEKNGSFLTPISQVTEIEKNLKLYNENQLFIHTPRLKKEIEFENIELDPPPVKENIQKIPAIFTMGSSAIVTLMSITSLVNSIRNYLNGHGDLFSLLMDLFIFGLMMVMGLFLPMLMEMWEKQRAKKNEIKRQEKYRLYIKEKEEQIKQCILNQENILKNNNVSLNKIVDNITNNCKDIWSREVFDNDFLTLTLGIGNTPAKLNMTAHKKSFSMDEDDLEDLVVEFSNRKNELKEVPITISLLNNSVMPIVIDSHDFDNYLKSLILQLIYFYSGNDLKIITITNEFNKEKWEYMKFLPHSWNANYDKRFFATNEEEVRQLSLYLERIYETRINTKEENDFYEYYLIITDDYKLARELSIINKILDNENNLGFSLLVFEKSIKNLPSKFKTFIQIVDNNGRIIERNTVNNEQISFKSSYLSDLDINTYAKIIANIPLNIKNAKNDIPQSLNFLEMYKAGRVEQLNVLSRWEGENDPTISLKAPIGMKENNKLMELDLHEKFHGPHGLIAGSTGSGKSELIITFILSMAINYHPYEVQFVLIDYKGGGLAGAFENRETGVKLPHLIGTITNLDINEMNRTLVSIKSELQRRQRVFNKAREENEESTIDIYKYQRMYREGKVKEPMSHLFIISDEFAELKVQQPDFMNELISAARIGRSLGVHLILATQKPSGVVDDQIWSNARFKICLKVQTTEDSLELLKREDAAYITDAGRFYLQVGNNELFEMAQSGWAGARYVPSDNISKRVDDNISFVSNTGEVLKQINEEVKKEEFIDQGEQLTNIVKYLYNLAKRENIKFSSLWLDNIPDTIYYNDIMKKYSLMAKPFLINPIIGEYDDPENQMQGYVDLPLSIVGNTFIVGASGSGKNTLLSTIIYAMIINHTVEEVNIYILDFGAEKLKAFKNAPQVGEVLTGGDFNKINFLFFMLLEEKMRRFAYYSEQGKDFNKDVENGSCPFPNIIVVINQFDVFKESCENLVDSLFGSFTRNCAKVGIYFIVTSSLLNSLGYVLENNFPNKIMLNMIDKNDYSAFFDKYPIPKRNPGRGLVNLSKVFEFQVPLIFEDEIYDKSLKFTIQQLNNYLKTKAEKVPIVPEEVTFDTLKPLIKDFNAIPLGVNIQTAQTSFYDFSNILNIITADNHITAKSFFPHLIKLTECLNNTRVIVINSYKNLKFENLGDTKYYDSNFQDVIKVIYNNVKKYKLNGSDKNFMVIFIGYYNLEQHLEKLQSEDEDIVTIDDLIDSAKAISNFKFVVYDKSREINAISDGKLDLLFKRNNGIWLGKGYDGQDVFDVYNHFSNVSLGNSNIILIKNGNTDFVKYM